MRLTSRVEALERSQATPDVSIDDLEIAGDILKSDPDRGAGLAQLCKSRGKSVDEFNDRAFNSTKEAMEWLWSRDRESLRYGSPRVSSKT